MLQEEDDDGKANFLQKYVLGSAMNWVGHEKVGLFHPGNGMETLEITNAVLLNHA